MNSMDWVKIRFYHSTPPYRTVCNVATPDLSRMRFCHELAKDVEAQVCPIVHHPNHPKGAGSSFNFN